MLHMWQVFGSGGLLPELVNFFVIDLFWTLWYEVSDSFQRLFGRNRPVLQAGDILMRVQPVGNALIDQKSDVWLVERSAPADELGFTTLVSRRDSGEDHAVAVLTEAVANWCLRGQLVRLASATQ
jgi:hypothetical protein